ncbi:alpha-ketoglutarate-dependent dioxygenase AlkB [Streptomyces mesophilus]|uniref:alpha-ketoglutarate-dependent dioxygenase AlkB n=1 Tax=Streptomyces mesophilus TaxID=1775132 RepID=UPI0033302C56
MHLASRIPHEFISIALPTEDNPFTELSASVCWEDLGKGRQGATVTDIDDTDGVPLVRTTTRYSSPMQRFRKMHQRLAREIQERAALPVGFNNALVEKYTNAYRTMGGHSDLALDLADESFIAVFSCYRHPDAGPPRKLMVESKESADDRFEISLTHNSVVVFSVAANRRFKHRIVLEASDPTADNVWLGVTFRTSKTLLRFRDGDAYLPRGERLTLADEEHRREFYRLRRRENNETDFVYPQLTCTVSESDLMPPV